jgi:hypothetical protein
MNTNDKSFSRIKLPKKEKKQTSELYVEPASQPGYSFGSFLSDIGNRQVRNLFEKGVIRAKLNVSRPNDASELEADRIANEIVSGGSVAESIIGKTGNMRNKGCMIAWPGGVISPAFRLFF